MSVAAIVVGSLLIWLSLGTPAAVLLGRMIRLADQQATPKPPAGAVGEAPARRAHLHIV